MKRLQAGFTLIEMLVALTIGSVMMAMAIPNISQMREGYRLRSTTREVFMTLQKARMAAIKENINYRVYLTSTTYTVHNDENRNGQVDNNETETTTHVQDTAAGVTLSSTISDADPLVFQPNGILSVTTAHRQLSIRNAQGTVQRIYIAPSGRIRVVR
ncbi:MAG: GspH/FimT family pseudopilin [Candidatus Binatia bacterium]